MTELSSRRRKAAVRVACALAAGLAFCLAVYLLLTAANPSGLISFSFLMILPAAVTAFILGIADPFRERSRAFYVQKVPAALLAAVMSTSILFLYEGILCIIMLAPIWFGLSTLGGYFAWRWFGPRDEGAGQTLRSGALLLLPVLAMQAEPYVPLPVTEAVVRRSIVVAAEPAAIWPLAQGVGTIAPSEGTWNLSQDVIRLPRPVSATLVGTGPGAIRHVRWQQGLSFKEVITDWQPAKRLWWRFRFDKDEMDGWKMQDRHLMPDSAYYRITDGGYTLQPLGDGRTRLMLTTRYRVRTPVNLYARLWGELILGDVSNNVLAVIAQRAEAAGVAR
ncbi:SRPBCC family protein [Sphingomonas sp. RS6]